MPKLNPRPMSARELYRALCEAREDLRFAEGEYDDTTRALADQARDAFVARANRLPTVVETRALTDDHEALRAVEEQLADARREVARLAVAYQQRVEEERVLPTRP